MFARVSATAGEGDNDEREDNQSVDASLSSQADARTSLPIDASIGNPDARVTPDASIVPDTDAGTGLICSNNGQCTEPGTCCLSLEGTGFCGPGTIDPFTGTCLPI
jgi:hypothetical protein